MPKGSCAVFSSKSVTGLTHQHVEGLQSMVTGYLVRDYVTRRCSW